MMNQPVLVLSPGNLSKSNNNSLDSLNPDHLIDVNQKNVNNQTMSGIAGNHQKKLHFFKTKRTKAGLKTIHNAKLNVSKLFENALNLKEEICKASRISVKDVMLISEGKELLDDDSLCPSDLENKEVFVIVRPKSTTLVKVELKSNTKDQLHKSFYEVPLNTKVFQLKNRLYNEKIVGFKPDMQRLILNGKQLQDNCLIGDYLLHSSNTTKSSEKIATFYVSKTIDVKHEVEVGITLKNKKSIKFRFEIGQPIVHMHNILHDQFHFMPMSEMKHLKFYLVNHEDEVELDKNKTLLDYGITPNAKKITIDIAIDSDYLNPMAPNPMGSSTSSTQTTYGIQELVTDFLVECALEAKSKLGIKDEEVNVTPPSGFFQIAFDDLMIQPSKDGMIEIDGEKLMQLISSEKLVKKRSNSSALNSVGTQKKINQSENSNVVSSATNSVSKTIKPKSESFFGGLKKGFLNANNSKSKVGKRKNDNVNK